MLSSEHNDRTHCATIFSSKCYLLCKFDSYYCYCNQCTLNTLDGVALGVNGSGSNETDGGVTENCMLP